MNFADKVIQDGKLTEYGERACAAVYEHYTGKCWHNYNGFWQVVCKSCGMPKDLFEGNSPIATSLDAWRAIWDAMTAAQKRRHHECMADILNGRHLLPYDATPLDHLEAALMTEIDCGKCGGFDHREFPDGPDGREYGPCKSCTNGKTTLMDVLNY